MSTKQSLISAIIKAQCPKCRRGKIFASFLQMHETCPHCHTKFEREPGYFMMAVFMGYVLYAIIFLPIVIGMYISGVPYSYYLGVVAAIIILMPWVFRYARVLWLHIDQILDPRPQE